MSSASQPSAHASLQAVRVCGIGSVSPAGWGSDALIESLRAGQPLATGTLPRPGWTEPLRVRPVPPPLARPGFLKNPRLRRTSFITQYAVAAALEAVGAEANAGAALQETLGIILCTMSGCVQYSRRFYSETLQDPATASPMLFPDTVFNAPASHLASLLGSTVVDYTLVGDTSTYFQGLALGAHWLRIGKVTSCLVVGAEEMDWPTADAFRLFSHDITLSAGAGAILLRAGLAQPEDLALLQSVPEARAFHDASSRVQAMGRLRAELADEADTHSLLCDGLQDVPRFDRAESWAWKDWPGTRLSPKRILGEGLTAATAWQCVAAVASLQGGDGQAAPSRVVVTNAGCNQQAGAASFVPPPPPTSP